MDAELKKLFEAIRDDVARDKCVLILGPDLHVRDLQNKVWDRSRYFKKIEREIAQTTLFESDGVFSTNDDLSVERELVEFYSGPGDSQLIDLISTIRFPLILNTSPDEALKEFLCGVDPSVRFEYFQGEVDEKKQVKCSINSPLIYNVFGTASDSQSIITTHKSLYKRIQQILPKHAFPAEVRTFLKNSRSFLFIGFKFDSWSYQLLSYKILSENESNDRMIRLSSTNLATDDSVNIIMSSAVGMKFTRQSPSQILSEVISTFRTEEKKRLLLRSLTAAENCSVFLSYAHANEEHPRLSDLRHILKSKFSFHQKPNISLIYDENGLGYGQSIDSFMTRIGKGKTVILLVSDKYFKSDYCMIEALRVSQHSDEGGRIFVILIEDGMKTTLGKVDKDHYIKHWKDTLTELSARTNPDRKSILTCLDILGFLESFSDLIDSTKNFRIKLSEILFTDQEYRLAPERVADFNKFLSQLLTVMKNEDAN